MTTLHARAAGQTGRARRPTRPAVAVSHLPPPLLGGTGTPTPRARPRTCQPLAAAQIDSGARAATAMVHYIALTTASLQEDRARGRPGVACSSGIYACTAILNRKRTLSSIACIYFFFLTLLLALFFPTAYYLLTVEHQKNITGHAIREFDMIDRRGCVH
ncbi:hypothetical protein BS78_01G465500 [Paspalum vaginatum]|nr:hypothetical protein BS78_01G465500 [Paspalum vaginatum]